MTVAELQAALQTALDRGLPPTTTVVLDTKEGYMILHNTGDPSDEREDHDMWFTLIHGGEEADCRFTEGGMPG